MRLLAVLGYCCCGGGSLGSDVTSGPESADCLLCVCVCVLGGGEGLEDSILLTWVDEEVSQCFFNDDGDI